MKRPMAVCGFTILISLLVASFFTFISQIILMYAIAIGLFIIIGHYKGEQRNACILVLSVSFVSIFYMALYTTQHYEKVLPLSDTTVEITGEVTDKFITQNGNYAYKIKVRDIENYPQSKGLTLIIYSKTDLQPDYYDTFQGKVKFFELKGLDYSTNQTKGIFLTGVPAYGSTPTIHSNLQKPLIYNILRARDQMADAITQNVRFPENQILIAMLFGNTSGISDGFYAVFRRAGIVHCLSVSGMHILILSQFLSGLLKLFRIPKKVLPYVMIACIIIFVAMTGFALSAVRAGIMSILFYSASIFKRETDPLNSLAISSMVILLFLPLAVRNVSFQLSFLATFGMIFSAEKLSSLAIEKLHIHAEWIKELVKAFMSSVTATIFLIPLLLYYFGELSVLTPLANILTSPFIMVALSAGIVCALFSLIPSLKAVVGGSAVVATFCLWITETVLLWLVQLPFASITMESSVIILILFGILSIAIIAVLSRKLKTVLKYGGIMAAIVFVLLWNQGSVFFTEYDDVSLKTGSKTYTVSLQEGSVDNGFYR